MRAVQLVNDSKDVARVASLGLSLIGAAFVLWGAGLGARIRPEHYASRAKIPGLWARSQRPEDMYRYLVAQARSGWWVTVGSAIQFVAVVLAFWGAV